MKNIEFTKWLEIKYLAWQQDEGGRRTMKEFAAYLGIHPGTLTNYTKGKRTPSGDHVHRIAEKLGGEIYNLLGITDAKDIKLQKLLSLYDQLDEEDRRALVDEAKKRAQRKSR